MKYIARIIFYNGSKKKAKFNTPGKAIDYVVYWWEAGYPVVYGDVIKHMENGMKRRIYNIHAGI